LCFGEGLLFDADEQIRWLTAIFQWLKSTKRQPIKYQQRVRWPTRASCRSQQSAVHWPITVQLAVFRPTRVILCCLRLLSIPSMSAV